MISQRANTLQPYPSLFFKSTSPKQISYNIKSSISHCYGFAVFSVITIEDFLFKKAKSKLIKKKSNVNLGSRHKISASLYIFIPKLK